MEGFQEDGQVAEFGKEKAVNPLGVAVLGAALALRAVAWPTPVAAQAIRPGDDRAPASTRGAVLVYTAPTSGTWGPSRIAPPTFAFGKPAEVLVAVPGGYVVRQELPLEDALAHATYVSQQVGHPIPVTIPDPAGGPARIEYVGRSWDDVGK